MSGRRVPSLGDLEHGRAFHLCTGEGKVASPWYESSRLECDTCGVSWSREVLRRFSMTDIADRFFVPAKALGDAVALVWVEDPISRMRYVSAVPTWQAEGKERVKV